MRADPGLLDLSPGARLLLGGTEVLVEWVEPQHGLVMLCGPDGQRRQRSVRSLVNDSDCRPVAGGLPSVDRGRQPASLADLPPVRRDQVRLRVAHLLETETGYRSGDPLRPLPGEPRAAYDPAATTLAARRQAKAAELGALGPDEAKLLGWEYVSERTLRQLAANYHRFGPIGCVDGRWLRRRSGHRCISEQVREAIFAVHAETLHRSKVSMRARERLIHQYVRERFAPGVQLPAYETLRVVWAEWFGPGAARPAAKAKPSGGKRPRNTVFDDQGLPAAAADT